MPSSSWSFSECLASTTGWPFSCEPPFDLRCRQRHDALARDRDPGVLAGEAEVLHDDLAEEAVAPDHHPRVRERHRMRAIGVIVKDQATGGTVVVAYLGLITRQASHTPTGLPRNRKTSPSAGFPHALQVTP